MWPFVREDYDNLRRWVVSAIVVLLLHAVVGTAFLIWRNLLPQPNLPSQPMGPVAIDLPPLTAPVGSPASPSSQGPSGPPSSETLPGTPQTLPETVPQAQPEAPPQAAPQTLPQAPPQQASPQGEPQPAPVERAEQAAPAPQPSGAGVTPPDTNRPAETIGGGGGGGGVASRAIPGGPIDASIAPWIPPWRPGQRPGGPPGGRPGLQLNNPVATGPGHAPGQGQPIGQGHTIGQGPSMAPGQAPGAAAGGTPKPFVIVRPAAPAGEQHHELNARATTTNAVGAHVQDRVKAALARTGRGAEIKTAIATAVAPAAGADAMRNAGGMASRGPERVVTNAIGVHFRANIVARTNPGAPRPGTLAASVANPPPVVVAGSSGIVRAGQGVNGLGGPVRASPGVINGTSFHPRHP